MRLALSLVVSVLLIACESAATPGASCSRASDCASPLGCHFGRCRSACSADRDCTTGASCLLDVDGVGTCTVETDLGCETGVGRECASGLACIADHCRQICGTTQGCATGSLCTPTGSGTSFCAPAGFDAGTPVLDAGDAGGASDAGPRTGVGTVCIGDSFICATRATDGAVFCWGQDVSYALGGPGTGCGTRGDSSTPLQVPNLVNVDQLACGTSWACAHQTSGEVLCWGESYSGQIIPGIAACDRTPHVISGADFADGALLTTTSLGCALDRADGSLLCWGADEGTVNPMEPAPSPPAQLLPSLTRVTHFHSGAQPSIVGIDDGMPMVEDSYGGACYVESSDDTVWCWGSNRIAQRAQPITTILVPEAALVAGLPTPVTQMAHASASTCVLAGTSGDLWCWGISEHGELAQWPSSPETCTGVGPWECSHTPLQFTAIHFSEIASQPSSAVTCGIASSGVGATVGDVYCWGSGQFLTNTRADHQPIADPRTGHVMLASGGALSNVREVVVAHRNACAIDTQGALYCWGENLYQQLQAPSATLMETATAVPLTPF